MDDLERKRAADRERQRACRARKAAEEAGAAEVDRQAAIKAIVACYGLVSGLLGDFGPEGSPDAEVFFNGPVKHGPPAGTQVVKALAALAAAAEAYGHDVYAELADE